MNQPFPSKPRRPKNSPGFALVATVSVMVLLLLIAVGFMSLAAIEIRQANHAGHQEEARANARMALMLAIGELQKHAGPDQRVTARAAILENPSGGTPLANRNWLGIWKTTYQTSGKEWPLIGKAPSGGSGTPYPNEGIYSDLRESVGHLQNKGWRDELLQGWLVSSSSQAANPASALSLSDPNVLEILGRGTLGDDVTASDYLGNRVLVEKVEVASDSGLAATGAYGWYVSDNNQKASIALLPDRTVDADIPFLASQTDNPAGVKTSSGATPYTNYLESGRARFGKVASYKTAAMTASTASQREALARAFGSHFHHLTTDGAGLFVDTALGGLKKDLTPLLFGDPQQASITMASPGASVASHAFSSDYPIIPGRYHGVLGPSFGGLRYWGRMKELSGLSDGSITAQTKHSGSDSTRFPPTTNWPHNVSDGVTFDGGEWASKAPKIHPVMTDCRWHYYFSHTDDSAKQSFKTHIIPRVCLWNPYNVEMKTEPLVVLMANPYWRYTNAFHFYFNDSEALRMKQMFPASGQAIDRWGADGRYKIRARGSASGGAEGLFPDSRYLGFLLEATSFAAGECLVFSPSIRAADESAQGVSIQRYHKNNVAANVLSARAPQGEDHFFHDYETQWIELQTENASGNNSWLTVPYATFREMRLGEIYEYESSAVFHDSFPFVLKAVNGSAAVSTETMTSSSASSFPTLQLINHGNGGASTYDFWQYWLGTSVSASNGQFGDLTTFQETPRKDAPGLHQIGTKLLWLDESSTEANNPPIRVKRWSHDQLAYNPVPVAHWNVRPGLATRSPASPVSKEWYVTTSGAWMLQFAPYSPQDSNDLPSTNRSGYFVKSPLGAALQFSTASQAAMFDLPDARYGALSLGSLRHAQLSPYSWHPSYLVGHSLADIHAPFETSAHLSQSGSYSGSEKSRWDEAISGTNPYSLDYGPRTWDLDSTGLLQTGSLGITKNVDGTSLSSRDEVLAYDIAYEVNQNLWDQYFFSGIPLSSDGMSFNWDPGNGDPLWNERHQFNSMAKVNGKDVVSKLNNGSGNSALSFGFWHNAYLLKNKGAFNVNSTSVEAWTAFLSGLQGLERPTHSGTAGGGTDSVFSRIRKPFDAAKTGSAGTDNAGGWSGGRELTEDEVRSLAEEVVKEVKERGPFISLADFVNRRLAPKSNPASMRGVLEAAILHTGLNSSFEQAPYLTTTNNSNDNNVPEWVVDLDKQPKAKSWGIPGYLTQGDLLEPLASSMTVRGDSFLVRAYGESRNANGDIVAKAYIEAVVERTPDFVNPASIDDTSSGAHGNNPIDPVHVIDRVNGGVSEGNLTEANKRYGRKFVIKSFRWLANDEV
ncbi:MAG: hypothetical protein H7A51_07300 [Akkermansiaceae bacterium]|nr:hypothetical protein [Akkermansiaceae bacterium]